MHFKSAKRTCKIMMFYYQGPGGNPGAVGDKGRRGAPGRKVPQRI